MTTIELIKLAAERIGSRKVKFRAGAAVLEGVVDTGAVSVEINSRDTHGVRGEWEIDELELVWAEMRRVAEARRLLEELGYRVYRRGGNAD